MKKRVLNALGIFALAVMMTPNANAQVFEEGASIATLGYGFPSLTGAWLKLWTIDNPEAKQSNLGPIHLKYEYGLTDRIGLGASINFSSAKLVNPYERSVWNQTTMEYDTKSFEETIRFTSFNALIRVNYHYLDHDKVDFYTGVGIGYNKNNFKYSTTDPDADTENETEELNTLTNFIPIGYEATLGLRYMFSDNIGAYMEVGYAKSLFQIGVAARF